LLLQGVLRRKIAMERLAELLECVCILVGQSTMTALAARPWRSRLRRERSLPAIVTGPPAASPLRRFAALCASEVMAALPFPC